MYDITYEKWLQTRDDLEYFLMSNHYHISDCLCDTCIIVSTLASVYHYNKWKYIFKNI